jgi:hypothetical protein
VNERHLGFPAASSTIPAIHWRTATTPAGPITPNASAPFAAPSWLDKALPNIIAGPAHGRPACCAASPPVKVYRVGSWCASWCVSEVDRVSDVVCIPPGCAGPALA